MACIRGFARLEDIGKAERSSRPRYSVDMHDGSDAEARKACSQATGVPPKDQRVWSQCGFESLRGTA